MKANLRDLIGKPYAPHGRGPDAYDCFGLAIEVLSRYGIALPDAYYLDENRSFNSIVIEDVAREYVIPKVETPEDGDLVVMRINGVPSHIGVYIGDGKCIHAWRPAVKVSDMTSIRNKIEGIYRWPR